MYNHLHGKWLFTWLPLMKSFEETIFVLSSWVGFGTEFVSISENFPTYFCLICRFRIRSMALVSFQNLCLPLFFFYLEICLSSLSQ